MMQTYPVIGNCVIAGRRLRRGDTTPPLDERRAVWLAQQGAIVKDGIAAQQAAAVPQTTVGKWPSGCCGKR